MRNAGMIAPRRRGRLARMRLNKYLGESGACSRRAADALISEGRVTLNGVVAVLGMQVAEGDEVRLDGELVGARTQARAAGVHRVEQAGRHHVHDGSPRRRQHHRLRRPPRAHLHDRAPRQVLRGVDPAHQRRRRRQRGAPRRARPREGVRGHRRARGHGRLRATHGRRRRSRRCDDEPVHRPQARAARDSTSS